MAVVGPGLGFSVYSVHALQTDGRGLCYIFRGTFDPAMALLPDVTTVFEGFTQGGSGAMYADTDIRLGRSSHRRYIVIASVVELTEENDRLERRL